MIDPKICILTQTATELPDYYREFFKDFDLFFITFKQPNSEAIGFLPGSTMHEGRNYMWEHVKGRYDYYLFIDDDQVFFEIRPYVPRSLETVLIYLQKRLRFTHRVPFLGRLKRAEITKRLYRRVEPARFKARLFKKIATYRPMVASLRTLACSLVYGQDQYALLRNWPVRRLTWFDAQVTLFSATGAELIMPYLAGWWSPQVPTYCLSNLAFKDRAIYILDMAASNENHFVYRDDFDGRKELQDVTSWLSQGLIDDSNGPLFSEEIDFINYDFASDSAKRKVIVNNSQPETLEEALASLSEAFDLHHPYIYERHKALIDGLDEKQGSRVAEEVCG